MPDTSDRVRRPIFFRVTVIVVMITMATTSYALWNFREIAISRNFDVAAIYARTFEIQLTQTLKLVDLTMGAAKDDAQLAEKFSVLLRHTPYLRSLSVLGREGKITASSNPRNIGVSVNLTNFLPQTTEERPMFRIGSPWVGRDFHEGRETTPEKAAELRALDFIPVLRSVAAEDGHVVSLLATINTDYFLNYFDRSIAAEMGAVSLLRNDGTLLLSTDTRQLSGRRFEGWVTRLAGAESGQFEPDSDEDHAILAAYRASSDYPFVVVVNLNKQQALSGWRQEAVRAAIIVSGLLLLGLVLFKRYLMRIEQASLLRRQVKEAAQISQERLETIARLVPGMLYQFCLRPDGSTCLPYASAAIWDIYRLNPQDVREDATSFLALLHPEDAEEFMSSIHISARSLSPWRHEYRVRLTDGEVRWLFGDALPQREADGSVLWHGFVTDRTDDAERQRAEESLRIAASAFQTQEGMVITDANHVILRVNQAYTRMTGYTAEESQGMTPHFLRSEQHDDHFHRDMWTKIQATGEWQGEVWDRRKSGEIYPKFLTISAVRNEALAVTHYIGVHQDITERKKAEKTITELAYFDQLTGLPNRTLLRERIKQLMADGAASDQYGALMFIDLDNFKTLNDTLGHAMGDQLLKQVAQRLTHAVRVGDVVARLGGDEFVVILAGLGKDPELAHTTAQTIAEHILTALRAIYALGELSHKSTASVGVSLFKGESTDVDVLMKQADLAMYKSKALGRNAVRFFDPVMAAEVHERVALEHDLQQAMIQSQFLIHFQAQIVGAGQLAGAEALVRWQHPQRGMIEPADFIPAAEESGLILPLGYWVLESACNQLTAWAGEPALAPLTVSVNVSAQQFRQSDFVTQVLTIVERAGAPPERLKLELTETLFVDNIEDIIAKMTALKACGIGFALDDFGTGYSSLAYLKRLPLDELKIDQSFVRDVLIDSNDAAIAKTVINLAHSLGLGVMAEGVETQEQQDFLVNAGCHAFQGYFFGQPLPADAFEEFARMSLGRM